MLFSEESAAKAHRKPEKNARLLIELSSREVYYCGYKVDLPNKAEKHDSLSIGLLKLLAHAAIKTDDGWVDVKDAIKFLWPDEYSEVDKRRQLNHQISMVRDKFDKLKTQEREDGPHQVEYDIHKGVIMKRNSRLKLGIAAQYIDVAWHFDIPREWRID